MRGSPNFCTTVVLSSLLLFASIQALAQLRLEPVRRKAPAALKTKTSAAGRTQSLEPMELPFWDDFSFANPLLPNTPHDTLWEDSTGVWVNNGMAINAPTVYTASFDGLDAQGLPYNATDILSNGYTDELVSRPLRMDLANQTNTYLSFYYQWKGNGDPPEDTDYLAVEFKGADDKWVERTRIHPKSYFDRTVFYDTTLFVNGANFFHDKFQFRFRSYGREAGPYDNWNLDYVYLNDFRLPTTPSAYADRALASQAGSLLGSYRAVPLVHFIQNPQFEPAFIDVQNMTHESAVGRVTTAYITNYNDGVATRYDQKLQDTVKFAIENMQRLHVPVTSTTDASTVLQLSPEPDSIDIRMFVLLDSDDDKDNVTNTFIPGYDLRINDTLSTTFRLADYYAYDDGSAEYAASLTNANNRCVVEFPMLTEDYAYLTGFDVYLPDFAIQSNQTMDFLIYGPNANGDGPDENPLLVFNRTLERQGLDTFFHVGPISPAIQVKDVFYVGWLAPSLGKPKIGVDYSNDSGSRIFVNTNGIWEQNPGGFAFSLMIRPHVQKSDPPVVPVIPEAGADALTIFPNPCRGACYIGGTYDRLALMSSTGQPMAFETEKEDDRTKVSFPTAAPGLYLLQVIKGKTTRTEKLIVVR